MHINGPFWLFEPFSLARGLGVYADSSVARHRTETTDAVGRFQQQKGTTESEDTGGDHRGIFRHRITLRMSGHDKWAPLSEDPSAKALF